VSEDCLTLNIWAPAEGDDVPQPVMVWFYGGSFLFGSASAPGCDGAGFARRGVILVAANYRVGLLGYLAHPALSAESEQSTSGNYGVLDIVAALDWVRRNIAAFGGDPGRVTAFGVSAGSASLSLLLTSPLAEGLFSQVILQSPGAFRPLATLEEAEAAGLTALGPDLAALRALSADEVLAHTPAFVPRVRGLTTPRVLRPICDGWSVPLDERLAYGQGRFHPVPTIVGGNRDEGTALTASWPVEDVDAWRALLARDFGPDADAAARLYPVGSDGDVRARVAEVFGDTQFTLGAREVARAVSAHQPRTWRYLFTRRRPGQTGGPDHGDEVRYVFGALGDGATFDHVDTTLTATMQDTWVRFATTGDPNGGGVLPHWPPYRADTDEHLDFGDDIAVGSGWRREQLDFLVAHYDAVSGAAGPDRSIVS
jgi:carboxylesterase type B